MNKSILENKENINTTNEFLNEKEMLKKALSKQKYLEENLRLEMQNSEQ